MTTLFEHPLSPYAQKCKIALYEKGVDFDLKPADLFAGPAPSDFAAANPRAEVPALVDDGVSIFDSTIILEYVEERWPAPPLLPRDPAARARARMVEDVCDTHYDAINWGMMELLVFKRAEGDLAATLSARAAAQVTGLQAWLTRQLGDRDWFGGEGFGWGDLSVIPYVNASAFFGQAPPAGTALATWQARANARESVAKTAAAAAEAATTGMAAIARLIETGAFQREYRDHRLEWMIRSGGLSIVQAGLENGTIRFSRELS
jgi:glutathione S-transferase/RNA polymerase-associated protein